MAFDTVQIPASSVETRGVPLKADEDPTGNSVEFAIVAATEDDEDIVTWVAGNWDGTVPWSSTTKKCRAITPTIGGGAALLALTDDAAHKLFVRFNGDVVRLVGFVHAT